MILSSHHNFIPVNPGDLTSHSVVPLQMEESIFRNLFEFSPVGMAVISIEGRWLKANRQLCVSLGFTEKELLCLKYRDILFVKHGSQENGFIEAALSNSTEKGNTEKKYRCKNGNTIQVNELFNTVNDNNGRPLYFILTITPVISNYSKPKEVACIEDQFNLVVYATNDAIWNWDMITGEIVGNEAYYKLYDFAQQLHPSSADFMERIHPEDRARIDEHLSKVIAGSVITLSDEFRFLMPDGSYRHFLDRAYVVYDDSRKPLRMLGAMMDITDRKKIESDLLEAESKFRNLVEKSLAGVYIILDGRFAYVNPRFANIFGYTQEELISSHSVDLVVHPDSWRKVAENIQARMRGEKESIHYEFNGQRKDGTIVEAEVFGNNTMYNGKPAIIGTLLDIGERKKSEREKEKVHYLLRERVKELTALYRSSQVFQSEEKSINQMLQEIVNILPGAWQYPEVTAARIILDKAEFTTANYGPASHSQQSIFSTSDGKHGMVEVIYLKQRPVAVEDAFFAEERHLIDMVAEMLRVSIASKMEAEGLKKSEANLHAIFNTTDTIYVLLDKNLKVISYNQRAVDFATKELKYDLCISKNLVDFFPIERKGPLMSRFGEVLSGQHINYESSYPQEDGSVNWYDVKMFPITSEAKTIYGFMLAVSDITTKKRMGKIMLDQKIQQQKKITRAVLKAEESERNKIGRELHDNVNQILVSAKMYLGMEPERTEPGKIDFIRQAKKLIDSAVNEIRSLSKSQVTPMKQIDLEELVNILVERLDHTTSISTSFYYKVNNPFIEDDLKLNIYRIVQEQINNILKYAEATSVNIVIYTSNKQLLVEVTDDGKGYDVSKKRNGIGISNMINRVESFNGNIVIESSPGNGCRLEVSIPLEDMILA